MSRRHASQQARSPFRIRAPALGVVVCVVVLSTYSARVSGKREVTPFAWHTRLSARLTGMISIIERYIREVYPTYSTYITHCSTPVPLTLSTAVPLYCCTRSSRLVAVSNSPIHRYMFRSPFGFCMTTCVVKRLVRLVGYIHIVWYTGTYAGGGKRVRSMGVTGTIPSLCEVTRGATPVSLHKFAY